jgi:hypothetical protein
MDSTFVSSIAGEDAAEASNLMMYELRGSPADTIRTALPKNATGYMVIFYAGLAGALPAAADKCDVWPVVIAANAKTYTAANEAARYRVDFIPSSPPGVDKVLT